MFKKLLRMIRGARVEVPGTDALAEGEARKVTIGDPFSGGLEVLLCRIEGKLHAIDTLCPHEGGQLVAGPLIGGKYAFCPLHNYRFDPRDGKPIGASCPKSKVFKVTERDGRAEICL